MNPQNWGRWDPAPYSTGVDGWPNSLPTYVLPCRICCFTPNGTCVIKEIRLKI